MADLENSLLNLDLELSAKTRIWFSFEDVLTQPARLSYTSTFNETIHFNFSNLALWHSMLEFYNNMFVSYTTQICLVCRYIQLKRYLSQIVWNKSPSISSTNSKAVLFHIDSFNKVKQIEGSTVNLEVVVRMKLWMNIRNGPAVGWTR